MDVAAAADAVGPYTAAIVPVHLYGQTVPMDAVRELAQRHDLFVLEDAAQAIGARWRGRSAGSIGDAAGFSFYPGKNLGALGDAGAVTTNDGDLAGRLRSLRSHGERRKYVHEIPGWCERLDAVQAAMLSTKLGRLDSDQKLRDEVVAGYDVRLREHPVARPLQVRQHATHVFHQYVVRVPRRDLVRERLAEAGVDTLIHYPVPLHRQPALRSRFAHRAYPVADALARSSISLPLFPGLTDAERQRVCDRLDAATADLVGHALTDQGAPPPEWAADRGIDLRAPAGDAVPASAGGRADRPR
jgi:dTDP-4-amino-4,6-dideoxygalactose transaminase